MDTKPKSLDEQMNELQKQTCCPLADSKLFIFMQAMDPYRRRYIVLECPAKRQVLPGQAADWKVYEEEIRSLCCNSKYAKECEWYKKAKGKK